MRSVGVVLLAAGASTRLGRPKQLLPLGATTLLRHITEIALAVDSEGVVVVLGANADLIRPELNGLDVLIVETENWAAGMGASIQAGLAALAVAHPNVDSVLFLLCDQPFVSTELLHRLMQVFESEAASIVASEYGGGRGVPAVFARALFAELGALSAAEGAKTLIMRHRDKVVGVPFPEGTWDVDTEEDYQRLQSTLHSPVA